MGLRSSVIAGIALTGAVLIWEGKWASDVAAQTSAGIDMCFPVEVLPSGQKIITRNHLVSCDTACTKWLVIATSEVKIGWVPMENNVKIPCDADTRLNVLQHIVLPGQTALLFPSDRTAVETYSPRERNIAPDSSNIITVRQPGTGVNLGAPKFSRITQPFDLRIGRQTITMDFMLRDQTIVIIDSQGERVVVQAKGAEQTNTGSLSSFFVSGAASGPANIFLSHPTDGVSVSNLKSKVIDMVIVYSNNGSTVVVMSLFDNQSFSFWSGPAHFVDTVANSLTSKPNSVADKMRQVVSGTEITVGDTIIVPTLQSEGNWKIETKKTPPMTTR